jgi:hypothetical protein
MCFDKIRIRALWENKETKNILSLSLESVNVGSYDFAHPCDGLQNSHLLFKWPLLDTEFASLVCYKRSPNVY